MARIEKPLKKITKIGNTFYAYEPDTFRRDWNQTNIYKSVNGKDWSEMDFQDDERIIFSAFIAGNESIIHVLGSYLDFNNYVLRHVMFSSTDSGETFVEVPEFETNYANLDHDYYRDPTDFYINGNGEFILEYTQTNILGIKVDSDGTLTYIESDLMRNSSESRYFKYNGLYHRIADNGEITTSADLIEWNFLGNAPISSEFSVPSRAFFVNNKVIYMGGESGNRNFYVTENGCDVIQSGTHVSPPSQLSTLALQYANGLYFTIRMWYFSSGNTVSLYYSSDLNTWTNLNTNIPTGYAASAFRVWHMNGVWYIANSYNQIYTHTSLASNGWTPHPTLTGTGITIVADDADTTTKMIAVSNIPGQRHIVRVTTDGETWTEYPQSWDFPNPFSGYREVNGKFVFYNMTQNSTGRSVAMSDDGITWTHNTQDVLPYSTNNNFLRVYYSDNFEGYSYSQVFNDFNASYFMATEDAGETWTVDGPPTELIHFGNSFLKAVKETNIMTGFIRTYQDGYIASVMTAYTNDYGNTWDIETTETPMPQASFHGYTMRKIGNELVKSTLWYNGEFETYSMSIKMADSTSLPLVWEESIDSSFPTGAGQTYPVEGWHTFNHNGNGWILIIPLDYGTNSLYFSTDGINWNEKVLYSADGTYNMDTWNELPYAPPIETDTGYLWDTVYCGNKIHYPYYDESEDRYVSSVMDINPDGSVSNKTIYRNNFISEYNTEYITTLENDAYYLTWTPGTPIRLFETPDFSTVNEYLIDISGPYELEVIDHVNISSDKVIVLAFRGGLTVFYDFINDVELQRFNIYELDDAPESSVRVLHSAHVGSVWKLFIGSRSWSYYPECILSSVAYSSTTYDYDNEYADRSYIFLESSDSRDGATPRLLIRLNDSEVKDSQDGGETWNYIDLWDVATSLNPPIESYYPFDNGLIAIDTAYFVILDDSSWPLKPTLIINKMGEEEWTAIDIPISSQYENINPYGVYIRGIEEGTFLLEIEFEYYDPINYNYIVTTQAFVMLGDGESLIPIDITPAPTDDLPRPPANSIVFGSRVQTLPYSPAYIEVDRETNNSVILLYGGESPGE